MEQTFNILSMDARAFRCWARLMHRKPDELTEDAMIAATAAVHNLTVVTCNTRDFERLDVRIEPVRGARRLRPAMVGVASDVRGPAAVGSSYDTPYDPPARILGQRCRLIFRCI